MAQKAVTDALPAQLRNAARRIALMLTILVALSACGSATAQFNAALTGWNKTVLPKYTAAVTACNKATP